MSFWLQCKMKLCEYLKIVYLNVKLIIKSKNDKIKAIETQSKMIKSSFLSKITKNSQFFFLKKKNSYHIFLITFIKKIIGKQKKKCEPFFTKNIFFSSFFSALIALILSFSDSMTNFTRKYTIFRSQNFILHCGRNNL